MRLPGLLLIVCVALGFAPSFASGDWTAFVPRPFENGAFLDGYSSVERDNLHSGPHSTQWTDTFFKETLTLYSHGYSYHPRFLQYRFSVSGALKEEYYDSSSYAASGWQYGSGLEYDANLFFLPEHPYNLQLYARRYEPLFKEQAATQHNLVETSRGASFRYRDKPYFLHASYGNESVESAESSSDVTRFYLDGEYFKRYTNGNELSFNAGFNPTWFSSSQGLEGSATQYHVGNFVNLRRVRLTSNLTQDWYDQKSPTSGHFTNDQLAWYERLNAYLPWDVRADLTYRYQKRDGTIDDPGAARHRTLSDTDKDIEVDVIHRLYQSLDTTYSFRDNSRTSSGGDSTFLSHSLTLNYTKLIPRGRILSGINVGRGDADNSGQADVVNEPHETSPVPGSFNLSQQNVDPRSIAVFLRSPLPPFEAILLMEDVDYVVIPVLNTFEIRLLTLPPQFVVPGTYDFFVSYSLSSGDFELRTDTYGGNASVELFDHLLTPYFSYAAVRPHVLSGVFPGIPLDATTYTTGLLVQRGPLQVRGEYQDLQWNISPYRSWRVEVQYVSALNSTTGVYATASYLNRYYPRGVSESRAAAFTEETASGSGSIRKQLFLQNMYASAGGSYARIQGRTDSNAYSLNAALVWKIGRLELTFGATAYASDTTGTGTFSTQRDHERFYLKLRRELF